MVLLAPILVVEEDLATACVRAPGTRAHTLAAEGCKHEIEGVVARDITEKPSPKKRNPKP